MLPSVYRELKRALERRRKALLVTIVAADEREHVGKKGLFVLGEGGVLEYSGELPEPWRTRARRRAGEMAFPSRRRIAIVDEEGRARLAYELFAPRPRLAVVGAGHVGAATCSFAADAGFSVAVLDDRPSFAAPERLPKADLVVCDAIGQGLSKLGIDEESAVVVVTRGHLHDTEALLALDRLGVLPAYVGLIGSRRRVLAVAAALRRGGVDPRLFERLYAPVGLDIGAESPEEIALAIVAEVLCVLRGRGGGHLRLDLSEIPPKEGGAEGHDPGK